MVFLTATDDKEMESKGLSMGALDFIRKPFEPINEDKRTPLPR